MTETRPVRSAATIILWREGPTGREVLMGQRGAAAAFMPSKYVFPGGAVDPGDAAFSAPARLSSHCCDRLLQLSDDNAPSPLTLAGAALRELREETGHWLIEAEDAAPALRFVFRAITPPGRPRRFDARFFLADAKWLGHAADDFSQADDELSHLHWINLADARQLDLPFITEVVLAEVTAILNGLDDHGVPFFDNSANTPQFRRIL